MLTIKIKYSEINNYTLRKCSCMSLLNLEHNLMLRVMYLALTTSIDLQKNDMLYLLRFRMGWKSICI